MEIICTKYLQIALTIARAGNQDWWKFQHSTWYLLQRLAENFHEKVSISGSFTPPIASGEMGLLSLITPSRIQELAKQALQLQRNHADDDHWKKFLNGT